MVTITFFPRQLQSPYEGIADQKNVTYFLLANK